MTTPTEKINYALSLVDGATPGPWAAEIGTDGVPSVHGQRTEVRAPGYLLVARTDAQSLSGRRHGTVAEQEANAQLTALSPLIPAALRLALADVRYRTLRHAVIPQSVEHTTRHRKLTDEAWREAKDALDAFLSLLPEPTTKED